MTTVNRVGNSCFADRRISRFWKPSKTPRQSGWATRKWDEARALQVGYARLSTVFFPAARPRPAVHTAARAGFPRIVFDVAGEVSRMVPVASSALEVTLCPES